MGRLWQHVGIGADRKSKRVDGTDTLFIIKYEDFTDDQRKETTYTKVVCKFRTQKEDPNRTWITIRGNHICYPVDVRTSMGSQELVKMITSSVLSRWRAKFSCFHEKNFCLGITLKRYEYVRIHLADIPQEFVVEYQLSLYVHYGWVYF